MASICWDKKGFPTVENGRDFSGVGVFLCLEGLRAALEHVLATGFRVIYLES